MLVHCNVVWVYLFATPYINNMALRVGLVPTVRRDQSVVKEYILGGKM